MADRKETPDVLDAGSLLAGEEAPVREKKYQASQAQKAKPVKKAKKTPAKPVYEKQTFYLSPDSMDALEEAYLKLRMLAQKEGNAKKVSKSVLVDYALHRLRDELGSDRKAKAALTEYLTLKEEKRT